MIESTTQSSASEDDALWRSLGARRSRGRVSEPSGGARQLNVKEVIDATIPYRREDPRTPSP